MSRDKKEEIIRVDHITKRYDENSVLEDFSLSVYEGEVVVIVGPSGCGKSTILRIMNGLEPIQKGEVTYRGEKVDGKLGSITRIREKVGMVFQSYELFPHKTILQNVMLAPVLVQKRDKKEVKEDIKKVDDIKKNDEINNNKKINNKIKTEKDINKCCG